MKFYVDFQSKKIVTEKENTFFQAENLANKIEFYVANVDADATYYLSLEFLLPNGRKTSIMTRDAFADGEDNTLTKDDVDYDIHKFTLNDTVMSVAGMLGFTCYINFTNASGAVTSRGVLVNGVNMVVKTTGYTDNTLLVLGSGDDAAKIVKNITDELTRLNSLVANKADLNGNNSKFFKASYFYEGNVRLDTKYAKINGQQATNFAAYGFQCYGNIQGIKAGTKTLVTWFKSADTNGNIGIEKTMYPTTTDTNALGTKFYKFSSVYSASTRTDSIRKSDDAKTETLGQDRYITLYDNIAPYETNIIQLGSSEKVFGKVWVNELTNAGLGVYVSKNLLPKSTETYSLGNSDYKFSNVYAKNLGSSDSYVSGAYISFLYNPTLSNPRLSNATVSSMGTSDTAVPTKAYVDGNVELAKTYTDTKNTAMDSRVTAIEAILRTDITAFDTLAEIATYLQTHTSEYTALLAAVQGNTSSIATLNSTEAGMVAKDALRDSAEALRVTAENGRVSAEAGRVTTFNTNEANRQSTFNGKMAEWESEINAMVMADPSALIAELEGVWA